MQILPHKPLSITTLEPAIENAVYSYIRKWVMPIFILTGFPGNIAIRTTNNSLLRRSTGAHQ